MAQFWNEPLTRETLAEFFSQFGEAAYSYIYSITGDEAKTEKMVEDAFIKVYRQRKKLQPPQLVLVLGAELDKASGAKDGTEPTFEPIAPDVACMARMLNFVLRQADSIIGGWGANAAVGGAAVAATSAAAGVSAGESQQPTPKPENVGEPQESEHADDPQEQEFEDDENSDQPPPLESGDPPNRKKLGFFLLILLFVLGGSIVGLALWGKIPASGNTTLTTIPNLISTTPAPTAVLLTPTPTATPGLTTTPALTTATTVTTATTTTKAGNDTTTKTTTKASTTTTKVTTRTTTKKATTAATTAATTTSTVPVTVPTTTATPTPTTTPAVTTQPTTTPTQAETTPVPTTTPKYAEPEALESAARGAYDKALKNGLKLVYDDVFGTYTLPGTVFYWDTTLQDASGQAQLLCGNDASHFAVTYDPQTGSVYAVVGGNKQYYDPQGNVFALQPASLPNVPLWFNLSAVNNDTLEYTHAQTGTVYVYDKTASTFAEKTSGDPYTPPATDYYVPDDGGRAICQPRYDSEGHLYWVNTYDTVEFNAKGDGTWIKVSDGSPYTLSLPPVTPP